MDCFNMGVFSSELKYDLGASNKLRSFSNDCFREPMDSESKSPEDY